MTNFEDLTREVIHAMFAHGVVATSLPIADYVNFLLTNEFGVAVVAPSAGQHGTIYGYLPPGPVAVRSELHSQDLLLAFERGDGGAKQVVWVIGNGTGYWSYVHPELRPYMHYVVALDFLTAGQYTRPALIGELYADTQGK